MAWFKRRPRLSFSYDPARQEPAVRRSICTGEMTVGFVDKKTGKFSEVMLADQKILEEFCRQTGTEAQTIKTLY